MGYKIVYDKKKPLDVPRPPLQDIPSMRVGLSGVNDIPEPPNFNDNPNVRPPVAPPPYPLNRADKAELLRRIEAFKGSYDGLFGLDSVVPSSGEVLKLNILFSIYAEIVGLREDLKGNQE